MPEASRKPKLESPAQNEGAQYSAPRDIPKSRKPKATTERVVISEQLPTPDFGSVVREVQSHFRNTEALKKYVDYLDERTRGGVDDLNNLELPNGQTFKELGWNDKNATELVQALRSRVAGMEEKERVADIRRKIAAPEAPVAKAEPTRETTEDANVQEKIHDLREELVQNPDDREVLARVKRELRKLSLATHPDRWPNNPTKAQQFNEVGTLLTNATNRLAKLETSHGENGAETNRLQAELNKLNNQAQKLQDKIDQLRRAQPVSDKISNFFKGFTGSEKSKSEQDIIAVQAELDMVQADQHTHMEDIQALNYRAGMKSIEGKGRGPLTPESVIEAESAAAVGRVTAEERYGKATEKSVEKLEDEYLTPPKEVVARKRRQGAREAGREEAAQRYGEADQKTAETLETEIAGPAAEQEKLRGEQNEAWTAFAEATLDKGQAHQIWNEIYNQMGGETDQHEYPFNPTEYVIASALYTEALKRSDEKAIATYERELNSWNKLLKFPKGYSPLVGSGKSRLTETRAIGGQGRGRQEIEGSAARTAGSPETTPKSARRATPNKEAAKVEEPAPEYHVDLSEHEPATAATLPRETLEMAAKGKKSVEASKIGLEVMKPMTAEEASTYVDNAADLWNVASNRIESAQPTIKKQLEKTLNSYQLGGDHPATKFVFETARYQKARKLGADEMTLGAIKRRLDDMSRKLGLGSTDAYRGAIDNDYREAGKNIPHAEKFVTLLQENMGLPLASDEEHEGEVVLAGDAIADKTRDILVATSQFMKAEKAGDKAAVDTTWEKLNQLNEGVNFMDSALFQSYFNKQPEVNNVRKGTNQRQQSVRRSNTRNRF